MCKFNKKDFYVKYKQTKNRTKYYYYILLKNHFI